eukprot:TRINITY_DN14945_c0_g1_i1.p1 TRINITY_DN14945_c0_g1~~TRINITY_DN14945_c0_g1_i1.p1  ORF type:complete len:344 (+),score=87.81 TRINITY_DN14945_c0_g1_i1:49-1080(+)
MPVRGKNARAEPPGPRGWQGKGKEGKAHGKEKKGHVPLGAVIEAAVASGAPFYSFEYSAARDPKPQDLYDRVRRMVVDLRPLWVDVTWGFGDVGEKSIAAAKHIQKDLGIPCLMHFILTDKTTAELEKNLADARAAGVRAILAMRGYTQAGYDRWQPCAHGTGDEPVHADALVQFIRARHGDWFSIGVAGFPEGHPESDGDCDADVRHLKMKVDAGAEFVICQFCFEAAAFERYVARCRAAGITVPILPGVMPLTEYATARLLSDTWGVRLPGPIEGALRAAEAAGDGAAAREAGEAFISKLCRALLAGGAPGLHFFVYDAEREIRGLLKKLQPVVANGPARA